MTKKMYYTETEAAELLGCTVEALTDHVSSGKIRVFKDGMQNVYTAKEVDALASDMGLSPAEEAFSLAEEADDSDPFAALGGAGGVDAEIGLSPMDTEAPLSLTPADDTAELDVIDLDGGDEISLEPAELDGSSISLADLTETPAGEPAKDDTVLSVEGASIFDQADFEVEGADPMAATQINASMEDQISMDAVGGGSGLLDLTRESDDTSLGAEILEHIDADSAETPPMGGLLGDDLGELTSATTAMGSAPVPFQHAEPTYVEIEDPIASLFGGMAIGCGICLLFLAGISLAAMLDLMPSYLEWLTQNLIVMIIGPFVVIAMASVISFLMGKSAAQRQAAIRRSGG